MDEVRKVALAYYENLSDEDKRSAEKFFQKIDANGDGKISRREYAKYVQSKWGIYRKNFKALDIDGSGSLDFQEAIVLFYQWLVQRDANCAECGLYIKNDYYCCFECYSGQGSCYDLCCDCYRAEKFKHHSPSLFCDNQTLLHKIRSTVQKVTHSSVNVESMYKVQGLTCAECGDVFLKGTLYFCCVQCYAGYGSRYDICCSCYGGKKFNHHEGAIFCDNQTLLHKSRSIVQNDATTSSNSGKHNVHGEPPAQGNGRDNKLEEFLGGFSAGMNFTSLVTN